MIVYKATNKANGKVYIGYTSKTLEERIYGHFKKSTNAKEKAFNQAFKLALRKYGRDAFEWEELFTCETKEEACVKEIEFIKEFNSVTPNGYNMTLGGEGGIPNEDVKKKISESLKKFNKENPRYAVSKYMEKTTPEQRSEKGKRGYQTRLKNGNNVRSGFKQTEEARLKMKKGKAILFSSTWYNITTKEIVVASPTQMQELTGISSCTFSHMKNGRQAINKCGWIYIGGPNETYFDTEELFSKFVNRYKFGIKTE
jgi:predicted GIY-YIG superfamily endonuclease